MRVVSYTRATSCHPDAQIPADFITQQNDRIKAYVRKRDWKVDARYCDRKHNTEESAAFHQLVEDGIQRKFDMVIVDSIYCVGRDLWSAREVLLQTFHYAGISFAVVEDDYVSLGKSISEVEAYFQSASKELKKALLRKRNARANQHICWNDVKYGYCLSESGEMVIEEAAAPVVREIFRLRLSGMMPTEIATTLNQKGIPGPRAKVNPNAKWSGSTIQKLLHNSAYAGHWIKTVQGVPILFENEAIITEDEYAQVQKLSAPAGSKVGISAERNLFASLVVDSASGEILRLRKAAGSEHYFTYDKKHDGVKPLRIPYRHVEKAALDALENECRMARKMEKLGLGGMDYRKQKLLADVREDMWQLFQNTAESLKSESGAGADIAHQQEPVFQKYMDAAWQIEVAFSNRNPWIKLYANLEIQSLDSNLAFRRCIERIEVDTDGALTVVSKEYDWKQLLVGEQEEA